jgi:hypothetical protein
VPVARPDVDELVKRVGEETTIELRVRLEPDAIAVLGPIRLCALTWEKQVISARGFKRAGRHSE